MKLYNPATKKTVEKISSAKNEPEWILEYRLNSLKKFEALRNKATPMEKKLLKQINYYKDPAAKKKNKWEDIPAEIKETFDVLGLPQAEKDFLAGIETQYNSEAIYGSLKRRLGKKGVVFTNIEKGLKNHPALFKRYFGKLVKPENNLYAAANGAFWSGGSFLYVPSNTQIKLPLQAYFRIGALNLGQFERTLIIVEKDSSAHYVEGCTAPSFSEEALHAGVVEVFVGENAHMRYTTIQNWSKNVQNMVTKKSSVERKGRMSWVDTNLGSKETMKYPSCYLRGEGSFGEMLSVTYSTKGQKINAGARMIHEGMGTKSRVISRSIARKGSEANYVGELRVEASAKNTKAQIRCDSLLLDEGAKSKSLPKLEIKCGRSKIEHEASATKLDEERVNYLISRGLTEMEARNAIIQGFIEPVIRELPLEYALEFNKLMESQIK